MMKQKVFCLRLMFIIYFILWLSEIAFAGAPIPWGAKLIGGDIAVSGNEEERHMASYEAKASKQELLDYYMREMPNRGYRLFINSEQSLIFIKAEELVLVAVSPSQGGKTHFLVGTGSIQTASSLANAYNAEVNCTPIPSVPIYPGARCMNSTRFKSSGSSLAGYSTEDPTSAVLDFYRGQMPRYGWQPGQEINFEDVISESMQAKQQPAMDPQQQAAMRNLYGGSRGLIFTNQKENRCSVQVMSNPANKGGSLINIIYEDKTARQ